MLGSALGTLSRSCSAALRPFLSRPLERKGVSAGLTLSLSPQGFVLAVTIIREAVEEIRCYLRDKEVNSQVYSRLTLRGQRGSAGAASCRGLGRRAAAQSQAADSPEAEFKARGWWGVGAAWQDSLPLLAPGGQPGPRGSGSVAASPAGQALRAGPGGSLELNSMHLAASAC